ncbi:MAG: multiheme c-type cytochrome [Thermoguttaceae bacterium]|jgi:hypothetical protein|nr:multiheme c-type cytochrome [Thermoguttaceae bacterium]
MKYGAWLALSCAAVVPCFLWLACPGGDSGRAVAVPPLSLDGYLDEKLPEAPKKQEVLKADNFACHVCHANYQTEELALVHARAGVGCVKCHGPSLDHCDDEAHEIPPDVMFSLEQIDAQCAECHKSHHAPATEVLARYLKRVPAKIEPGQVVCTDCHGEHRLARRTVVWDRKTRKLVVGEDGAAARAERPVLEVCKASASRPQTVDADASRQEAQQEIAMPMDPWAPVQPRGADNSRCHTCHEDYAKEPLAEEHRKANVGCVKCHGASLGHGNDETGAVPPDIMYWPERIDPACAECHPKHNAPANETLVRWRERFPEKTDPHSVVCTDCHGEHRLKSRSVCWDRKTGKLTVCPQK